MLLPALSKGDIVIGKYRPLFLSALGSILGLWRRYCRPGQVEASFVYDGSVTKGAAIEYGAEFRFRGDDD
jgi:hypothetical protein